MQPSSTSSVPGSNVHYADSSESDEDATSVHGCEPRDEGEKFRPNVRGLRRHELRQALRHSGVQRLQRVLQEKRPEKTDIQVSATVGNICSGSQRFPPFSRLTVRTVWTVYTLHDYS